MHKLGMRSLIERVGLDNRGTGGRAIRVIGARLPDRVTFGPRFPATCQLIEASEGWSAVECKSWMIERIQSVLAEQSHHALGGPPWPDWLSAPRVPVICRSDLVDDPGRYRSSSYRGPIRWVSTGGTGGRPATFPMEPSASAAEWAYVTNIWNRFGFRRGGRRLVLRGIPPRDGRPVAFDPLATELRVSPFHLSASYWKDIVAAVREFRPEFIHGYPSAVMRFTELCSDWLPRVRALFLCSEDVPDELCDRLEGRWKAPVVSWYGHSEKQLLGGNCPGNRAYHLYPTYGFGEVLNPRGKPAAVGESGSLVVTGFLSKVLQLVRYETGDTARFLGWGCGSCGLQWPMIDRVAGRWVHSPLYGRNGIPVTMAALNFHGQEFSDIRRMRYVQESSGLVDLVIEADTLSTGTRQAIMRAHEEKLGAEFDLRLHRVDEIPLMPSGKHLLVDQRIPEGQRNEGRWA